MNRINSRGMGMVTVWLFQNGFKQLLNKLQNVVFWSKMALILFRFEPIETDYNLKQLFSIWIDFKMQFIPVFDKAEFSAS